VSGVKTNIVSLEDIRVVQKFITNNWLLLVLIPAFFAGVAYFYTHRLPEIYGAKTEILLKSGEELDYQSQVYSSLAGFYSNYADITNQKRVLNSYDLTSKVLDRLDYTVTYYVVGRVKTIPAANLEPVEVKVEIIDKTLNERLIDLTILDDDRYRIGFDQNGTAQTRDLSFGQEYIEAGVKLHITKKPGFSSILLDELVRNRYQFLVSSHDALVNKYRGNLSIENVNYTSVLSINVEDELVDRAKTFLDTLSKVYINYTVEKQLQLNENTIQYIDLQLNKVSEILDSIENDMEIYKVSNAILDLSKEEDQYFKELVKYESMKKSMELKLDAMNSLEKYIQNNEGGNLFPPGVYMLEDQFLNTSLEELYRLQINKNKSLLDVTDGNFGFQRNIQSIDSLRKDLLRYMKSSRASVQERIYDVSGMMGQYELKIQGIPASQRDIVEIRRKLVVNEKMYTFLSTDQCERKGPFYGCCCTR
jgi:uncharacterized protein involved in exopolysaccharide biosynthesis